VLSGSMLALTGGVCPDALGADDPAARTPNQWLERMDAAFRNLDYDGVFSYYAAGHAQIQVGARTNGRSVSFNAGFARGVKLATFRIVHVVVDGVERERIAHLDGPHREILRTGDEVVYLLRPGDELLDLDEPAPAGPYARAFMGIPLDLGDYYRVAMAGMGRVAGRPAVHLAIVPLDVDRYGHRLWLDEATALLLRSELHDSAGNPLEMVQFTSLRVGDEVSHADLEPAAGSVRIKPPAPASPDEPESARPQWQTRWVPAGFRLTRSDAPRSTNGPGVATLTFSDGLAAFSVFVETMPEAGAGNVVSRSGATVVLTHSAAGEAGKHLVTVVGEIPVETAQRVAAGLYSEQ